MANIAAMAPGVMGITGIETGDIVKGIVDKIKPDLVVAVDALSSRKMNRVSTTIQISNVGIILAVALEIIVVHYQKKL